MQPLQVRVAIPQYLCIALTHLSLPPRPHCPPSPLTCPPFPILPSTPTCPHLTEESDQKDSESDVDLADLIKNNDLVSALVNDIANRQNVENATKNLSVNVIHPLREGKKLLVLDIDYSEWVLF